MKKYYSLSQYPGTTGQYYYNWFFNEYNIDAYYSPIGCEIDEFNDRILYLLSLPETMGISISMPYKQKSVNYCNNISDDVVTYGICNTIVKQDDLIVAYNCDLAGVRNISSQINKDSTISILGDGAIGKMFYQYLTLHKYHEVTMYSRKHLNWEDRHNDADVIINCTALGTINTQSPLQFIPNSANMIIDLSMKEGKLAKQCFNSNKRYIGGIEFYCYQFLDQFNKYTNFNITKNEFNNATIQR